MTRRDGGREPSGSGERDAADRGEPRPPSAAERITLAVSSALVLAVVGLLVYLQFSGGDQPPTFEATPLLEELHHDGAAWYLPIAVANRGDGIAEQVLVRAELGGDAGSAHAAEFTVDVLPGGETAEGVAVFPDDPRAGDLVVRVAGFR